VPVSPVGDKPIRLATIPVVLCVAIYCGYRVTDIIPWGGYDPGFVFAEQMWAIGIYVALGAVQLTFAFRRPSRAQALLLLAVQVALAYGPYLVFSGPWDPPAALVVATVLLTFTGWHSWALAALAVLCDVSIGLALEPGLVSADGEIVPGRALPTPPSWRSPTGCCCSASPA
jgi:hypothetical protein